MLTCWKSRGKEFGVCVPCCNRSGFDCGPDYVNAHGILERP